MENWLTPVLALVGSLIGSAATILVSRHSAKRARAEKSHEQKYLIYTELFVLVAGYPQLQPYSAAVQSAVRNADASDSLGVEDELRAAMQLKRCDEYAAALRNFVSGPNGLVLHQRIEAIVKEIVDMFKGYCLVGYTAQDCEKLDGIMQHKIAAIQKLMRKSLGTNTI